MHILYEENGGLKSGTILAESDASLQVETAHGKRAKIKANAVMLRFEAPGPVQILAQAQAWADAVDVQFLWECCGEDEFGFADLARD